MGSRKPPSLSRRAIAGALPLLAAACATPERLAAVPAADTTRAEPEVANVRYFPDRAPEPYLAMISASYARERAWLSAQGHTGPLPRSNFLTVSGGGGDGAFGAGLLNGWTEHGDRPEFKLVTGISTGALIAPFAFVGPQADPILRDTYTKVSDKDIFRKRSITAAIFNDALADTGPMRHLVQEHCTPKLLADIAAEYAKGRLLIIGTTNLDAREPVYWDMGAIASAGTPEATTLFRQILLASAAIPGAFPPVMIDVTVDGKRYQEMHVDGGATRQVFLYPNRINLKAVGASVGIDRERALYIVLNARLDPDWASVDRRTLNIAGRAVASLIRTQGVGDLMRMYITARRDEIDYNLAFIPASFATPKRSEFDPDYMRALFELGRSMAAQGYPWTNHPPGYAPEEAVTTAH